jgi:hypothetical protein
MQGISTSSFLAFVCGHIDALTIESASFSIDALRKLSASYRLLTFASGGPNAERDRDVHPPGEACVVWQASLAQL